MMSFPGESQHVDKLLVLLRDEFVFARRVLNYWLEFPKQRWFEQSAVGFHPAKLVSVLDIQACRQFRTAIELCERGESECAQIISRSLYETALATAFVLLPNVRLRYTPQLDKVTKKPLVDGGGNTKYRSEFPKKGSRRGFPILSRDTRAKLVISHNLLQDYRYVESHKDKPGRKRVANKLASNIPKDVKKTVEAQIGPEWTSVVFCTLGERLLSRGF